MEYDLNVNGQHFATGVSDKSFTVPRLGTSLVGVQAVSNLFSLLQQLRTLGSGWHPSYRLSGQLYLGDGSRLPFDQRGEVGRGS